MVGARHFFLVSLCILLLSFFAVSDETGNLQIKCSPGIRIYLDDQIAGVTTEQDGELLIHGIDPGTHKIRGENAEFIPSEFEVSIIAGETTQIKIGKDGAPMVLIPAGEFQMGTDSAEIPQLVQWAKKWDPDVRTTIFRDETPRHTVYLAAFYIDKYEVTVGQYKKFIKATGYHAPGWSSVSKHSPTDKHPIMGVSWEHAQTYCKWAGKRLPTEAEWEKAARGGLVGRKYPWGDEISHDYANYYGTGGRDRWGEGNAPVGSFPPNGYGLYDMAGNVWEWCADYHDKSYYSKSPRENPKGPESGWARILRGGSWGRYPNPSPDLLRVANRWSFNPETMSPSIGFRCIQDVIP